MDPAEDGLVLPADVGGARRGVEPSGGDQVQRLEALAAPLVRCRHRGAAQVFQRLAPLGHLHANHRMPPERLLVEAFIPPILSELPWYENSGSQSDRGLELSGDLRFRGPKGLRKLRHDHNGRPYVMA